MSQPQASLLSASPATGGTSSGNAEQQTGSLPGSTSVSVGANVQGGVSGGRKDIATPDGLSTFLAGYDSDSDSETPS